MFVCVYTCIDNGSASDLSRIAAALALAHAMAAKPRALQHSGKGLEAVTRGVTRVLTALEERAADFAPGKRGLQAKDVAAHATRYVCVGGGGVSAQQ